MRAVSYTHLRAHETDSYLVCRLLLEKNCKQSFSPALENDRLHQLFEFLNTFQTKNAESRVMLLLPYSEKTLHDFGSKIQLWNTHISKIRGIFIGQFLDIVTLISRVYKTNFTVAWIWNMWFFFRRLWFTIIIPLIRWLVNKYHCHWIYGRIWWYKKRQPHI